MGEFVEVRRQGGTFGRKIWVPDEDSYHPESNYWKREARTATEHLIDLIGKENHALWIEIVFPDEKADGMTWRDFAIEYREYVLLGRDANLDLLECTCKPDAVISCAACVARNRLQEKEFEEAS